MLDKLKKKLGVIYTVSSCVVLLFVLVFMALQSESNMHRSEISAFRQTTELLERRIAESVSIDADWLTQTEQMGECSIYIEDCGAPLYGSKESVLLDELYDKAAAIGLNMTMSLERLMFLYEPITTDVVELRSGSLASLSIIPFSDDSSHNPRGWRLVAVRAAKPDEVKRIYRLSMYIVLGLLGCVLMVILNRMLLERAIRPAQLWQRRQEEFIAAASHELRSPLAVIRANATLVSTRSQNDIYLDGITEECDRMSALISDMLSLAALRSTNESVALQPVDPNSIVMETYERYNALCREKGITLSLLADDDCPTQVMSDGERLAHILSIFVDNAISHSGSDRLEICSYPCGDTVRLSVRDHGCGVPDGIKREIWGSFYSGDSSRTGKRHFGLGLSICKSLAESLSCEVGIEDVEGGGAEFFVSVSNHVTSE